RPLSHPPPPTDTHTHTHRHTQNNNTACPPVSSLPCDSGCVAAAAAVSSGSCAGQRGTACGHHQKDEPVEARTPHTHPTHTHTPHAPHTHTPHRTKRPLGVV